MGADCHIFTAHSFPSCKSPSTEVIQSQHFLTTVLFNPMMLKASTSVPAVLDVITTNTQSC